MLLSEASSAGGFFNLVPWVVFFPVIVLLINALFGGVFLKRGKAGEAVVGGVASAAVALAFVVSVLLAVSLANHPEGQIVVLADWITIGELDLKWAFQVDTLAVTMMLVVSGVGLLIHIYAIGYMHEDVRHNGERTAGGARSDEGRRAMGTPTGDAYPILPGALPGPVRPGSGSGRTGPIWADPLVRPREGLTQSFRDPSGCRPRTAGGRQPEGVRPSPPPPPGPA